MRFLITAGPTREPIDPVRYLTNRSSGKMGYAVASAALAAGHEVCLISGPVSLAAPEGAEVHFVESAREMYSSVQEKINAADVAVFSAAVADYRVAEEADQKIKKSDNLLTLTLVKNPDILGSTRSEFGFEGILVGFAAETNDLEKHAASKLTRKECDLLVANDVSRKGIGFERDENEVILFYKSGESKMLSLSSKTDIAIELVSEIDQLATR